MTLTIELSDDLEMALQAQAHAKGVSTAAYVGQLLAETLKPETESGPPFETGYGTWAKYGPAPSAEEIDENRREMFRTFAQNS